jgi:hypothetical protein
MEGESMPAADSHDTHDSERLLEEYERATSKKMRLSDEYERATSKKMCVYRRAVPASYIVGAPPVFLIEKYCTHVSVGRNYRTFEDVKLYHVEDVFAVFAGPRANPEAVKAWADHKAARKSAPVVHVGCTVRWSEWETPFVVTKKMERSVNHRVSGCTVSVKGQFATITLPDGKTFRKRLNSAGFDFEGGSVVES